MALKRTLFWTTLSLCVFFYAWQMKSVHGLIPGIHLTLLVLSFFFLCSPLSSILISINQLLGSNDGQNPNFCQNFLLGFNVLLVTTSFLTLRILPNIFNSSGITLLFYQLMESDVIYQFLALSQGSFLGQFLISKGTSGSMRLWLGLLFTLVACLLFYAMIPIIQEVVVIGINSNPNNF